MSRLPHRQSSRLTEDCEVTKLWTLRRFEADYTSGGRAPTVQVVLDCTLGRHRDRALLGSFTASGSAAASEDRVGSVVAAFEAATGAAMTELGRAVGDALGAEKPVSEGR